MTVIVISLGIDDHDSQLVQLDYRTGHYGEGAFSVVHEAIETLEVILHQLNVMQATPAHDSSSATPSSAAARQCGPAAFTRLGDDA